MSTPLISFIVPLFNHLQKTQEMLASLKASLPASLVYEIIFVDDASSDGTSEWLRSLEEPNYKIICNPSNLGYAASNNIAVRRASGDVLALLNNDLLFEAGWLEPMLDLLMDKYLNVGLVGNVQYSVGSGRVDHAGVRIDPRGKFEHIREIDEARPYLKVLAATGACVLIRKSDFEACGGFDESFQNGGEDYDLCFCLRQCGKAIYVSWNSRIRHYVGLSRKGASLESERNSRLLQSKWRSEIKFELTSVWASLLSGGEQSYKQYLDGEIVESFMETPFAAARVVSENILRKQEHYWVRLLDGNEPNLELPRRVLSQGLAKDTERNAYRPSSEVKFELDRVYSAKNFYVCGYTFPFDERCELLLTLEVNGIQRKRMTVGPAQSVNFGIVDPLFLPGGKNHVVLRISSVEAGSLETTNMPMVLTHIIVDDRKFDDL
mgnify:CR=1 FL=1|jgi:Predicted glycosyltransferases